MIDHTRPSGALPWEFLDRYERETGSRRPGTRRGVATIYNEAGEDYTAYADGDPAQLFAFTGVHAYADRYLWTVLERKLTELRAAGADAVSILMRRT